MRPRNWNLDRADTQFSIHIRKRDGRCMNPRCVTGRQRGCDYRELQCSHYWSRGILISRFDPENCFALCPDCHRMWEYDKQGKYREVMERWLGQSRYDALRKRVEDYKYKNIPYLSQNQAIEACRIYLTSKT